MKHAMAFTASWVFLYLTLVGQLVSAQKNADLETLVQNNTEFAIDLYTRIRTQEGNLFLSPYSISTALAMTYGGARGETAKQMASVLHWKLKDEKLHLSFLELQTRLNAIKQKQQIQLCIANSLWPRDKYPFLKGYLDIAKNFYESDITSVDYATDLEAARMKINSWVETETNNTIKDLIPETPQLLRPETMLVLVNAIYFKGQWSSRFNKRDTTSMPFYYEKNSPVMVSMMEQTRKLNYGENKVLQVLEMPYAGDDLSMIILLPKEKNNIRIVEDILSTSSLAEWVKTLDRTPVNVYLPRFKLTSIFRLKDVLQAMGMNDAFVPGKADFSGMDGKPYESWLEFVLHKAFVDVNEEGTEASAATAVGCFPSGTEVLTDVGLRPIEYIDQRTKVYACDLDTGEWKITNVLKRHTVSYEGDIVTIGIGNDSIQSTGNQPFFVLRGDQLASRSLPEDVPIEEQKEIKVGRWVEAHDLKVGDLLHNKNGESLVTTELSIKHEKTQVYWLEIERYHNCAVHRLGILAHNQKRSLPIVFRVDHPFLFIIRENLTKSVLFMGRVSRP